MDPNAFFQLFGLVLTILGIGLTLIVQGRSLGIKGSEREKIGSSTFFKGLSFALLAISLFFTLFIATPILRMLIPTPCCLLAATIGSFIVFFGVIEWVAYVRVFRNKRTPSATPPTRTRKRAPAR